jgi:hypothetical protein
MPVDQVLQGIGKQLEQFLSLKELPFIEPRAVRQVETRHEIAAINLHRFF